MNFPYGDIAASVPDYFSPPEAWPEYGAITEPAEVCAREEVSAGAAGGIRWSLWPLTFEQYVGDNEPDIAAAAGQGRLARNRIARWQRIRRSDAPTGWRQGGTTTWRVDGFYPLQENPDYHAAWRKNARRDLKLWQHKEAQGLYAITLLSAPEYAAAYRQSTVAQRVNASRLRDLELKLARPASQRHTALWGVRNLNTNAVVGGTALIHSPSRAASTHFAPFITREGAEVFAATALMDHWFREALRRKERCLVTTNFWHPGKPASWQGFSEFKSHFGWRYAAYPPLLWRFVRGNLF